MTLLNVWARTNKNSTPVFFTGNGKLVEGCKKTIEGCTNPKAPNYNPNATIDNGSCEEEDIFISNSDEKTQASPKNKNKNFTCNKCGTKMPIKNRVLGNENISISCKIDIITDLVKESLQDGETNRLEKHWNYDMSGTKCIFNGSDVTSSWWGIFRAENLKLESISLNRDGTIKVLKINN